MNPLFVHPFLEVTRFLIFNLDGALSLSIFVFGRLNYFTAKNISPPLGSIRHSFQDSTRRWGSNNSVINHRQCERLIGRIGSTRAAYLTESTKVARPSMLGTQHSAEITQFQYQPGATGSSIRKLLPSAAKLWRSSRVLACVAKSRWVHISSTNAPQINQSEGYPIKVSEHHEIFDDSGLCVRLARGLLGTQLRRLYVTAQTNPICLGIVDTSCVVRSVCRGEK